MPWPKPIIKVKRVWEMPNKWTFRMKSVQRIFSKYNVGKGWADPFAGNYSPAEITNDIETNNRKAKYNMDGLDFLKSLPDKSVKGVLFDPPYSVEMCLRKYTSKFKGTAGRTEYWSKCINEIGRIIQTYGMAISFRWDSVGIGIERGFTILEILLICHGACHNDTIVTVERKIK